MDYKKLITSILLLTSNLAFTNPAFEGDWMIEIKPASNFISDVRFSTISPVIGLLQLERHAGEWKAWVEGGPAPITVGNDNIVVDVDARDIRGFVFIMRLNAKLENDRLVGSVAFRKGKASDLTRCVRCLTNIRKRTDQFTIAMIGGV
ncbi:uncharacterized protein METZ01_LOCUS507667, partial [marine metagenome]